MRDSPALHRRRDRWRRGRSARLPRRRAARRSARRSRRRASPPRRRRAAIRSARSCRRPAPSPRTSATSVPPLGGRAATPSPRRWRSPRRRPARRTSACSRSAASTSTSSQPAGEARRDRPDARRDARPIARRRRARTISQPGTQAFSVSGSLSASQTCSGGAGTMRLFASSMVTLRCRHACATLADDHGHRHPTATPRDTRDIRVAQSLLRLGASVVVHALAAARRPHRPGAAGRRARDDADAARRPGTVDGRPGARGDGRARPRHVRPVRPRPPRRTPRRRRPAGWNTSRKRSPSAACPRHALPPASSASDSSDARLCTGRKSSTYGSIARMPGRPRLEAGIAQQRIEPDQPRGTTCAAAPSRTRAPRPPRRRARR